MMVILASLDPNTKYRTILSCFDSIAQLMTHVGCKKNLALTIYKTVLLRTILEQHRTRRPVKQSRKVAVTVQRNGWA